MVFFPFSLRIKWALNCPVVKREKEKIDEVYFSYTNPLSCIHKSCAFSFYLPLVNMFNARAYGCMTWIAKIKGRGKPSSYSLCIFFSSLAFYLKKKDLKEKDKRERKKLYINIYLTIVSLFLLFIRSTTPSAFFGY